VPAATQYTGAQLAQLETARQARPDGHLLDLLPVPGDLMTHLPTGSTPSYMTPSG